jgi:hypothetical protein
MNGNTWNDLNSYYDNDDYYTGWGGYHYGIKQTVDINDAIKELISRVRDYDSMRLELEEKGGQAERLRDVTNILNREIEIATYRGKETLSLSEQRKLINTIRSVDFSLHIDIRQLHTYMPVYYICRVHHDYWYEHSIVAEDYYMSPGYPIDDTRFVKLMDAGHEKYFLRLSQFRGPIKDKLNGSVPLSSESVDDLLYNLGRNVFQAAWHEDQQIGILTAKHLELRKFCEAVELLYLCLSGELCELRSAMNENMLVFFSEIYPQDAIHAFLEILLGLDGKALNSLPQKAGSLYRLLSKAFSRFLSTEVEWGHSTMRTPLWKIVYGNFSRLQIVENYLRGDKHLVKASARLESDAKSIVDELLVAGI